MSFLEGLFGPPNIRKMKAKRNIEGLSEVLRRHRKTEIRIAAAEALGDLKDPAACPSLIDSLGHFDQESAVRSALVKIGGPAVKGLCDSLNTLKHKSSFTNACKSAAEVLGKIGDKGAVETLIEVLGDRVAHLWVRQAAAEALGNIGDARALGALCAALDEESKTWDLRQIGRASCRERV